MLYLVTEDVIDNMYSKYETTSTFKGVFETKELAEKGIAAMIEETEKFYEANREEDDELWCFEKLKEGYTVIADCFTVWGNYDITEIELNKIIE